jgi:preprotein translocase subunit SecG
MITSLMVFHAIISVLLIVLVLLQFGKGAEAGLLSGGAGESVLSSSQQGNILSKITVVISILFLGNSVLLAKLQSSKSESSLLDSEAPISRPLNSDAATAPAAAKPTKPTEAKKEKTTK